MKTAEEIISEYEWDGDIDRLERNINNAFNELRRDRDQYKEAWLDDLMESFTQACCFSEANDLGYIYDHMCISTWKYAQRELLKHGRIKPEECYRR